MSGPFCEDRTASLRGPFFPDGGWVSTTLRPSAADWKGICADTPSGAERGLLGRRLTERAGRLWSRCAIDEGELRARPADAWPALVSRRLDLLRRPDGRLLDVRGGVDLRRRRTKVCVRAARRRGALLGDVRRHVLQRGARGRRCPEPRRRAGRGRGGVCSGLAAPRRHRRLGRLLALRLLRPCG